VAAFRRPRAIGASSSQTSKTRSNSLRSKPLSDRMSRPRKLLISPFLPLGLVRAGDPREQQPDALVVVDSAGVAPGDQAGGPFGARGAAAVPGDGRSGPPPLPPPGQRG